MLWRCPFYGGVCLIEVSAFGGVRFTEAFVLQRCPPYGDVRFTEVSIKRELTVSVKKIYTMFYEISKRKVALIQELPSLLRPQPVRWEEGAGFSGYRVLHWYSKKIW